MVNTRHAEEWSDWFAAFGIHAPDAPQGQRLDGRELIAEAVLAGVGIGLLDVSVFSRQVRDGELVQLDASVPTGWSHYLVTPQGGAASPSREAFREWILAASKESIGQS